MRALESRSRDCQLSKRQIFATEKVKWFNRNGGGFNWSLQHLTNGGCDDSTEKAIGDIPPAEAEANFYATIDESAEAL